MRAKGAFDRRERGGGRQFSMGCQEFACFLQNKKIKVVHRASGYDIVTCKEGDRQLPLTLKLYDTLSVQSRDDCTEYRKCIARLMIIWPGGKVGRFHTKSPVLVTAYFGGENFTKDDHVEKTFDP